MVINAFIYTTTTSKFFQRDLDFVRDSLLQTGGIEEVRFVVRTIRAPEKVETIRDKDGDIRFNWDWFQRRFVDPLVGEYNVVGLHITPYYKKKYGLSSRINGTYHRNADNVLDFWFSCSDRDSRNGEPMSEATRLILHEIRHGLCHWASRKDDTHERDYIKKDLLNSFGIIDMRIRDVLLKLLPIVKQLLALWKR